MRSITVAAVIASAGLCATVAPAQDTPGPSDTARYMFHRVQDSFLRLDVRTGHVSQCSWRADGWFCRAAPDERKALESEITRLVASNMALKKELLARGLPLPDGIKPDPPVNPRGSDDAMLLSDAEIDRMLSFMEKVWRRMVEMMSILQRDMLRKS